MSAPYGQVQPPPYSTHPRPGQKTVETGPYPMDGMPPTAPPFSAYPPPTNYQGMNPNQPPTNYGMNPNQPQWGYYPPGYPQAQPPPPGYWPPQQNQPCGQPTYIVQEHHRERRNSGTENCCLYALCAACLACCFLDALD